MKMNKNRSTTHESAASTKRKKFEYLLQGNHLNTTRLETKIKKGNSKINLIFLILCILFSMGMLCATFLFLHLYRLN